MRRLLSVLLSISLIFQIVAFFTVTADSELQRYYAGIGDYTVTLQADSATYVAPSDFGTISGNGKVWTDKSVAVKQDRFEVTLSALAQEYISESHQNATSSVAADVVMVLDLSGSMEYDITLNNTTMTRTKAMVKAVNEALEIILRANQNNRVLIYTYQSDSNGRAPVTNELLPLGHYTNSSWTDEELFVNNSGKYFSYSTNSSADVISSADNLKKDGASFAKKSLSTASGTCTQHGIFKGVQALATAIGQESKSVDRKPYIMLFTDGAPGNATREWYNPGSTGCSFSHENNGSATITALSVLSASYMKNTLDTAYRTYNGKNLGIEWFNIGLGVGSNELGTLFLQPATIAEGASDNAESVQTEIATYTSGQYAAYADYASRYAYTVDTYIVDSGDDLQDAFTELAGRIEEETKTITSPIVSVEGATSDLTFTDTIGAGMSVSNICLHPDRDTEIFGIANGNTYSFNGYDMTATVTTDVYHRSVLTWNIPADELAIFAFANRSDPADGVYIAVDPIRLTYDVQVTDPDAYEGVTLYSNASATAEFGVPGDNTYYYEADGTMKSAPFAAQSKVQNNTGITDYYATYAANQLQNGANIIVTLGNNGKITPSVHLDKNAEDSVVEPGTSVTFTLAVTNKGQSDLSDVIVADTLSAGLTYQQNSVQNATVSAEGQNLVFTIPFVAAGQTVLVTYDAALTAAAATGETYTNTAAVTRINQVDVYGPAEVTSTITARHTYRVLYEWTGNIPAGVVIPADDNRYTTGSYYLVDANYNSLTKIENKDRFGNVTERWTFSGWTDPNSGVMGEADVTVRGVWNYENFTYSDHRVIYTWSGDIPPGKALPTDGNTYVKNQPYTVDSTYTAATVIETRDKYGNVNGRYTFSGWADPNHGVMGDEDVTIPGIWNYEPVNVPAYRVIYTWTGAIPEGHVPPTDSNSYAPNQSYSVDTTYPTPTLIFTYDAYGNINGKYTFYGWLDPNNGVMGNADVTISGVWEYQSVAVSDYRVFYVWSGEVPPDVTPPADSNTYVKNQTYCVDTTYTSSVMIPTYDAYGNVNGKYTFSGWTDPNNGVMGEADVTVHGIWEYESVPVEGHKVHYVWSGDIPEGLTPPIDAHTYVPNQTYLVDATYSATTQFLTYDAYGNVSGKYTFSGWTDPNNGIMGNEDVTIPGVWVYECYATPDYRVIYEWTGTIPPDAVLPTDSNTYVTNQPYSVDDTHAPDMVIPVYDAYGNMKGRYTFSGWTDPNNGIMGEADVTVRGAWEYEALAVPAHRVIYEWTGEIPPDVTLPADENTYVKNQTYPVDSNYTAETVILSYVKQHAIEESSEVNGKYTFSGWTDPNNGIVGDADVIILGEWKFEPIEQPPEIVPPEESTTPESPKTGEFWSTKRLIILMTMSVTGMLLVSTRCVKKKQ